MQTFARHRAWLAAPEAHVEVDRERDLVLVTFYPALADLDVDVDDIVSAGFHGEPGDQLLTTLALTGVHRWGRADDAAAQTARHLVGPVVGGVVSELARRPEGSGPDRIVRLTRPEGEDLLARWRALL